jgi:hypothetical protein
MAYGFWQGIRPQSTGRRSSKRFEKRRFNSRSFAGKTKLSG